MLTARRSPLPVIATCALFAAGAGSAPPAASSSAAPVEAIAQARHDLELGFTVRGRVQETLVEPGKRVAAGDALIRLDDREGEAQVRLYRMRAESAHEIDAAEATWLMSQNEEARVRDALAKGGAATFELERAQLQTKRDRLALELLKQRREEAGLMHEQARLQHERFTLAAPIAGRIEEVLVEKGEMVDEVRPVLRLVVTDPLWIDAPTPMDATTVLKVGQPAWVTFRIAGAPGLVEGKVIYIAAVADAGSETRIVRVETPNPTGLPAGSHVEVRFERPE